MRPSPLSPHYKAAGESAIGTAKSRLRSPGTSNSRSCTVNSSTNNNPDAAMHRTANRPKLKTLDSSRFRKHLAVKHLKKHGINSMNELRNRLGTPVSAKQTASSVNIARHLEDDYLEGEREEMAAVQTATGCDGYPLLPQSPLRSSCNITRQIHAINSNHPAMIAYKGPVSSARRFASSFHSRNEQQLSINNPSLSVSVSPPAAAPNSSNSNNLKRQYFSHPAVRSLPVVRRVLLGNSTAIPAPVPTTPAINMPLYCRLKPSQKPTAAESAITQTLHCQQEYSMAANNTTSQLVCCDNDETTQQVQDTINKMRISE